MCTHAGGFLIQVSLLLKRIIRITKKRPLKAVDCLTEMTKYTCLAINLYSTTLTDAYYSSFINTICWPLSTGCPVS